MEFRSQTPRRTPEWVACRPHPWWLWYTFLNTLVCILAPTLIPQMAHNSAGAGPGAGSQRHGKTAANPPSPHPRADQSVLADKRPPGGEGSSGVMVGFQAGSRVAEVEPLPRAPNTQLRGRRKSGEGPCRSSQARTGPRGHFWGHGSIPTCGPPKPGGRCFQGQEQVRKLGHTWGEPLGPCYHSGSPGGPTGQGQTHSRLHGSSHGDAGQSE